MECIKILIRNVIITWYISGVILLVFVVYKSIEFSNLYNYYKKQITAGRIDTDQQLKFHLLVLEGRLKKLFWLLPLLFVFNIIHLLGFFYVETSDVLSIIDMIGAVDILIFLNSILHWMQTAIVTSSILVLSGTIWFFFSRRKSEIRRKLQLEHYQNKQDNK